MLFILLFHFLKNYLSILRKILGCYFWFIPYVWKSIYWKKTTPIITIEPIWSLVFQYCNWVPYFSNYLIRSLYCYVIQFLTSRFYMEQQLLSFFVVTKPELFFWSKSLILFGAAWPQKEVGLGLNWPVNARPNIKERF